MLPTDWSVKLLPTVCGFRSGKAHEQYITESGRYVCVNSKFISSDGGVRKYSSANFCSAKVNDILMVISDLPNGKALAKAYLVEEDNKYAINQRVCVLSPYFDEAKYLFYALNRNSYFLKFDDGVSQTHLLNPDFQQCPLPIPSSIDEQRAIATALSDVDALTAGLERLIAKKRDIKQAAMQQLLTGQTRLPGFSGEWASVQLGDLLDVCHGKNQHAVEVSDGPYPILATGGQIGTASQPLHDRPSVLIGRKGTINKPQYMDTPFWTVDTLFYCKIHHSNSAKFLYYRFLLIDWMQYNEASGVPSLNGRTIERIEIECPDAKEQTAIATVLSGMDADLAALESRLAKTLSIKQGMMQELLTGRTRLI